MVASIIIEINFPSGSVSSSTSPSPGTTTIAPPSSSSTSEPNPKETPAVPELPTPVCLKDIEAVAKSRLNKTSAWDYFSSGAMEEETLKLNSEVFTRVRIRPRVLRDVSQIDTSVKLFGHTFATPIGISPTAMMKLCDPQGEAAVGRAAASLNQLQTLSTFTTISLEDVASAVRSLPDYPFAKAERIPNLWFQLYVVEDRPKAEELVRRAEKAGFSALVVTVDTPRLGRRLHNIRTPFFMPSDLSHANFTNTANSTSTMGKPGGVGLNNSNDASLNWDRDIGWLRSITKLPIVVKGILTAEDAELAIKAGVDAIGVSNHGGRQLDTVPATLEALPEIARVVKGRVPIIFDGGVRKGTDVFKALALGASFVCVGRPSLYALTWEGEEGVRKMLEMLNEELRLACVLAGTTTVKAITRAYVKHESEYGKL
ncbi:Hydroxyacid oxidase 2 [Gonapodya sp. JEL0774]|nr:Hydroxyacid oxidase 2 [Gonapodya sp. JEL0774]